MVYTCGMCSGNRVPFVALVRSRIRRHHKDVIIPSDFADNRIVDREEWRDEELIQGINEPQDVPGMDFQKQNALFLLKMKEVHQLTEIATTTLLSDTTSLVQSSVERVEDKVKDCLENAGIVFDDIPGMKDIFLPDSEITIPFTGLKTRTEQKQYFQDHFGLVEPERYVLGNYHVYIRSGTKRKMIAKSDEMALVPLLKSVEAMLNDPSIIDEIEHPHINKTNNGRIYDYCDGEACKSHPLFSRDPSALQIIVYFDEVECVNPLGSKTKKHKIGVFYYTLANIQPKYRSQLKSIQLLAIVKRSVINKYGINAILEPIMEDIIELEKETGYEFTISGKKRTFRGTIAFVSGDNLGSQELGGFKVGPGANLRYRECMGCAEDIKLMFREDNFELRTCEEHDNQCAEIKEDPALSTSYGVNFLSALCQSRFYHVIGGLPGDAMHDVLEGCLQYECKELLKYLICERKFFTLNHLNSSILNFDFGYQNDSDKPSPISELTLHSNSNTLHQRAAQMWCLARFSPLLVGAKVPETDEKWQLFLKLLDITDIIFSPVTSCNQAAGLAVLIEEHHTRFKRLYTNCSIIPKMHYLIHYPHIMIRLGPMTTSWCMRFEAKHRYFKMLAAGLGNFKNLPFTLAQRHQNKQCYTMYDMCKPTECGRGKLCKAGTTGYYELVRDKVPEVTVDSDINELTWASVFGTKYKTGAVVQTGFCHLLPVFSVIHKIVLVPGDSALLFVVELLDTIGLSEHYHSYEVQKPMEKSFEIYFQEEFATFLPMHVTSPVGATGLYVNVKYDTDLMNM